MMVARWKRRSDNDASWEEHQYQAGPTTPSDCKAVAMDGGGLASLAATAWYRLTEQAGAGQPPDFWWLG